MTWPNINPYPLGAVAPTSGTPLGVLSNVPDLALTNAKALTVYAPVSNTGNVYVGTSTLNRSTLAGVVAVVAPGETMSIPFDEHDGNKVQLPLFYLDVDTTGDKALPVALFA